MIKIKNNIVILIIFIILISYSFFYKKIYNFTNNKIEEYQNTTCCNNVFSSCKSINMVGNNYKKLYKKMYYRKINITPDYCLEFTIKPKGKIRGWSNIIHSTISNKDCCTSVTRAPGIWFFPNDLRLHIRVATEQVKNDGINSTYRCPINVDTKVVVILKGSKMIVKIYNQNNELVEEKSKTIGTRATGSSHFYISDPWYSPSNALIKNVKYNYPNMDSNAIKPGDIIALWSPVTRRFLKMDDNNGNVTSCCTHSEELPSNWPAERWLVVKGDNYYGYSDLICLYNLNARRFMRMHSNGNVDSCCPISVNKLPPPNLWNWERFKLVNAGEKFGKKGLVAFWNPAHKRFLRMNSNGNADSSGHVINSPYGLPNNWNYERFMVIKLKYSSKNNYFQIGTGDCPGNDVGSGSFFRTGLTFDNCKNYCNNLPGCLGIAYNESNGNCAPKNKKCNYANTNNGYKYFTKLNLESHGCWKDTLNRALSEKLGNYSINECMKKSKAKGNPFFAIQNGNECWTDPFAGMKYQKYGAAGNCKNGQGGFLANDVYKIKGVDNKRYNKNDSKNIYY